MERGGKTNRLDTLMNLMGVRANALAQASGADHSLITKWRRGERPLTRRSSHLPMVAQALDKLDTEGVLDDLVAPYRQRGESKSDAIREYLIDRDLPGLTPRVAPQQRITHGEYTVQYRVFLGRAGFRSAILAMLDYVLTLPPGREIVLVFHNSYDWLTQDDAYADLLMDRLEKAVERETRLTIICRRGHGVAENPDFALPWLAAHLQGHVHSLYYEGTPPEEQVVASIRGYWSLRTRKDSAVEDGLFTAMYTDMLDIEQDVAACDDYTARSRPVSQYGFLQNPQGAPGQPRLWQGDALPAWDPKAAPDGSFGTIQWVPGFGLMRPEEYAEITGEGAPTLPGWLFCQADDFAGRQRMILCRDSLAEGLRAEERRHEALSVLLGRDTFVPRAMLKAQVQRIVAAMGKGGAFQVALVPRVAFEKLQLEIICWKGGPAVALALDESQSVLTAEKHPCAALYTGTDVVWERLMSGWKRQDKVKRQLRAWLAGLELDTPMEDSTIVRNWAPLARD